MKCARAVALLAAALPAAAVVRARPEEPRVQPVVPGRTKPTHAAPRLRATASWGKATSDGEMTCDDCANDKPCLGIDNCLVLRGPANEPYCLEGETNCMSADSEEEEEAAAESETAAEADWEDPAGPGAKADADGGEEDGGSCDGLSGASVSVQ